MSSSAPIVDRIRIIPRPVDFLDRNVGSSGQVYFNRDSSSLRVYNGKDLGGFEVARADLENVDASSIRSKISITNDDLIWIPYDTLDDLPSAADNHGMFAHVHSTGRGYYAHAGEWIALANLSDLDGLTGGGGASVDVSNTVPSNPQDGNLWLDTNTGKLYIYINDGNSSQWIQPNTSVFNGNYDDLINKPILATVATSGSYNDLTDRPTFGEGGFDGTFSSLTGTPSTLAGYGITDAVQSSSATFTGLVTLQQTTEVINTKTTATGAVTHDYSTGAVFYHSNITGNFTANFTNVPTTNNRTISLALILAQGGTAYLPTVVQVDGVTQTIEWQGATTPTGNSNQIDLVSFTLIRTSSAWTVLGSLTTYG